MNNSYDQIIKLRDLHDDTKRGYAFEQIIREILPWTNRPPMSIMAEHEQLDAFYEWNNRFFLVECKAKKKPIGCASHDWEDFELKVRKRQKNCIGLFCSLFPVDENLASVAISLNREGYCVIILEGVFWDNLYKEQIFIEQVLNYMIYFANAKYLSTPPELMHIKKWYSDTNLAESRIHDICSKASATFLRRFKHDKHTEIYVHREIDNHINALCERLIPSNLSKIHRRNTKISNDSLTKREMPNQVMIIRDDAGAGKTTIAVQTIIAQTNFFGMGHAASEADIDNLNIYLSKIGRDYGIRELISINRPIVLVIDSLDEANNIPNKTREINSLMKFIDELNQLAEQNKLLSFPIGCIFTVREDYWRNWEAVFEGRRVQHLKKRFSEFTPAEFTTALSRYSKAYGFSVTQPLTEEYAKILSVPFNLQIFAEANSYQGNVIANDILGTNVMNLFFERKKDNIYKRNVMGFNASFFMGILSALAMYVVNQKRNIIKRNEIIAIICDKFPIMNVYSEEIVTALSSEQILVRTDQISTEYSFRHTRFIEYLVAYYVVQTVYRGDEINYLDELTSKIFDSGMIIMYRVHDFIRHICEFEHKELLSKINEYYSESHQYMSGKVDLLRGEIACGKATNLDDINLIMKKMDSTKSDVSWGAFFILAAKRNAISENYILTAFEVAWKANENREDRWKLINKLVSYGLVLREKVFLRVLESRQVKEWEIYLGYVLENRMYSDFNELVNQYDLDCIKNSITTKLGDDGWYIMKLLNMILNREEYILGNNYYSSYA